MDSNQWPSACKADALANWAKLPFVAKDFCILAHKKNYVNNFFKVLKKATPDQNQDVLPLQLQKPEV